MFDQLIRHAGLYVAIIIVLVGVVYGFADIRRLHPVRVWAISSVSFSESIRRRVLWVTPVAIVGILAVAQFLDPVDPQDALRQTTKVCLFATGMVVVITAIILACTNLPKEIESRVIYTIVTKPTTRLEIVLGKVVGFARVSGAVLLIMGAFTLGYLKLREWRTRSWIRQQLAANTVDDQLRPSFQLYADQGLLVTKSMADPEVAQVFGRPPEPGKPVLLTGNESQYYTVPFELNAEQKKGIMEAANAGGAVFLLHSLGYENRIPTAKEAKQIRDMRLPTATLGADAAQGSLLPSLPTLASISLPIPQLNVYLYDKNSNDLGRDKFVDSNKPLNLPPGGDVRQVQAPTFFTPAGVEQILAVDRFQILVDVITLTVNYRVGDAPLELIYQASPNTLPVRVAAAGPPKFESHRGRYGMQLRGRSQVEGSVAVFGFTDVDVPDGNTPLTFQAKIGVESAGDFDIEANVSPRMAMQVHNRTTGQTSAPREIQIDSNRVVPIPVAPEFVSGGDFDVYLRGLNEDMWYGLEAQSLSLVRNTQPFSLNLIKGLLVLWMLAILVVAISVFCSTFLSWPIAVVLTLFILLGHWGVSQLGDFAGSGLGTEVTEAMGLNDPTAARIVRGSVGFLTWVLDFVAQFLPDISRFPATEDIERGVSMPPAKIASAAAVLFGYGIPITILSYIFLRNKEVAP